VKLVLLCVQLNNTGVYCDMLIVFICALFIGIYETCEKQFITSCIVHDLKYSYWSIT
jgi:hypothetical protein